MSLPPVYVIQDFLCFTSGMSQSKIVFDPGDQVILESPLDKLVQNVRGDERMYVGSWKMRSVRLL